MSNPLLSDQLAGKAQSSQGISLQAFLSTLATSAIAFGLGVLFFLLARKRFVQVYGRIPLEWSLGRFDTENLAREWGLDAVLFLRYLRTLLVIFVPAALTITPTLVSLNLIHGRRNNVVTGGLDLLGWSNLATADRARLWAHVLCMAVMVAYVVFIIVRELQYYVRVKQTPIRLASSNLVLLTDIPEKFLTEEIIRRVFNRLAMAPQKILIVQDLRSLTRKMAMLRKLLLQLETAVTAFLRAAVTANATPVSDCRPTLRLPLTSWLPSLPFVGERTDKIDFLRKKLVQLAREVDSDRRGDYPRRPCALLQFKEPFSAQTAAAALLSSQPNKMIPHLLRTQLRDVIFENLGVSWQEKLLRTVLAVFLSTVAIFGWTLPVALIGILSQIVYLGPIPQVGQVLERIPTWVLAAIQGVLPQVLTTGLMALFPYVLRMIIDQRRLPTMIAVELNVQSFYFTFLFVHLFLTVSISAGMTTVLVHFLNSTKSLPFTLAQSLPKASNYFLSYVLRQSFLFGATVLVQLDAFSRLAWSRLHPLTPREQWRLERNGSSTQWGTVFPVYTNLACIVIVYAVLAPVILPLACVAFTLCWLLYRKFLLYVSSTEVDTCGRTYPQALFQLFTGLYTCELCLLGLLTLQGGGTGHVIYFAQACTVAGILCLTCVAHIMVYSSYRPLLEQTPVDIEPVSSGKLAAAENAISFVQPKPPVDLMSSEITAVPGQPLLDDDFQFLLDPVIVVIPEDSRGLSKAEIAAMRSQVPETLATMTDENAALDYGGRIHFPSLKATEKRL